MKYLILFLLIACNEKYAPPQIESCTYNENNLICADQRINKGKAYERSFKSGDICTNMDDYSRTYDYCADLRERLIRAEKRQK
jgi:hypothetical protein